MSNKTYMVVLTNPASEDREGAFNSWYDDVHIPELTALPGVLGATRFTLTDTQSEGALPDHKYLTLYEIDGDDVEGVLEVVKAAGPTMTRTDAIDASTFKSAVFRQLGG